MSVTLFVPHPSVLVFSSWTVHRYGHGLMSHRCQLCSSAKLPHILFITSLISPTTPYLLFSIINDLLPFITTLLQYYIIITLLHCHTVTATVTVIGTVRHIVTSSHTVTVIVTCVSASRGAGGQEYSSTLRWV